MPGLDFTNDDGDPLQAASMNALARHEIAGPSATATVTGADSALYIADAIVFQKRFAATSLRIDMSVAFTSSAASTWGRVGVSTLR